MARDKPTSSSWELRVKIEATYTKPREHYTKPFSFDSTEWTFDSTEWTFDQTLIELGSLETDYNRPRYDRFVKDLTWTLLLDLNWERVTWLTWMQENRINTQWT